MRGDELDLRKALGRYSCEAAVETASNAGITSTLGVPFVGTIDFPSGRLTWCKDNPTSASDVESALAFVRLRGVHGGARPRLRLRVPHRAARLAAGA